jgi:hypothetical protein
VSLCVASIDGYLEPTILEAKHVGNSARSPFVSGSGAPGYSREGILGKVDDEFRRMRMILDDTSNPFNNVEVITNNTDAKALFEQMLRARNLPPNVRIEK